MIRAACAAVVLVVLSPAEARANPSRAGDRLCAKSIYDAIRRDHLGKKWSGDPWPNVLGTIASLRLCYPLPAGLRRAAKRASRALFGERWAILAAYPPVDPPPACQPPPAPASSARWGTRCIPRDPRVVLLFRNEGLGPGGPERAFIAGVVDRLTYASEQLVPAAQLLWVYANLGIARHISAACPMHHDIEEGTVRLDELYWNPRAGRR